MGSLLSAHQDDTFRKYQESTQVLHKIKMERQIQLHFQIQERQRAMQIAKDREFCLWFTTFYATSAIGLFTGFKRTKRTYFLMPLVPLTFATLYFIDLGYGNKVHRIRMEAEQIMTHEADLLEWPCGLPTPSSVDVGRIDDEEKKKIHPPLLL